MFARQAIKPNEDSKIRVVPVPDILINMIQVYIAEHNLTKNDFVFSRYGIPIRKGLAEKWFSRVLIEAGVEKVDRKLTPHSLHFTYVTRMRRNESGETVKKLAGHSSIAMTDYYTRICIPEMVKSLQPTREAANRLFE